MSSLQEIISAVEDPTHHAPAALKYKKGTLSTPDGYRYEEHVLALVFLRCLRRGLQRFTLFAYHGDAGKFDDVALVWRPEGQPEAHTLLVQLKHKTSPNYMTIHSDTWLLPADKCDFGLRMYSTSYKKICEALDVNRVTCVLVTNASQGDSSLNLFEPQDVRCVPGVDLIQAGGSLWTLNQENRKVGEAVHQNTNFMEHFYALCGQSTEETKQAICNELKELLPARGVRGPMSDKLCEDLCDSLCKTIRDWMSDKESVCLTSDWSGWEKLVVRCIAKDVTEYAAVSTRLKYDSVALAALRRHVESCNPVWLRPTERATEALSATKVHQALADQPHIVVDVKRFTDRQRQILCCWGQFCRWLVVVDDDTQGYPQVLSDLKIERLLKPERCLVIVSSRENDTLETERFDDTCQSSDVSDDSWNELLDVRVSLNGARYECRLRDLVAGVDCLKELLDGRPALLLALARLSQPLRMGRELQTLPEYYVPRKLVNWRPVTDGFFSSLTNWDVCITDTVSYESLKGKIGRHSVESWEMESWFVTALEFERPLILLNDDLENTGEKCRRRQSFDIYMVRNISEGRWKIHYYSELRPGIRNYAREQVKELLETLDTDSNAVIVAGRPGVGKSTLLSDLAKRIKEGDPSCWLLRVNLLEFYSVLDNSKSAQSAAEFILETTAFNKDELGRLNDLGRVEYALLRHTLLESPRVVCLVDGFDEVCPNYMKKCLEVLPLLAPGKGRLVVTTRPEPLKQLEAQMDVLAHLLVPFSDAEQEDFFTHHPSTGKIRPISSLNKNLRDLLRIPLFAEMFASVSYEISETCDIVSLYEAFFKNKFRRLYEEKWRDDLSAPGKDLEIEEAQERHEKQLMLLAASVLLHSTEIPEKPSFHRDHFVKYGIVYMFPGGKPTFLHKTFAEHFLAKWCCDGVGDSSRAAAYREAYLDGTLAFFQESFDRRAVRGRPLLEAALQALLGGDVGNVATLLASGANLSQTDACGRNALHLVAGYREERSLPVLKRLCRHVTVGALSAKDDLLGWTPLRYAAERGHCDSVELLMAAGAQLGHLGNFAVAAHDPAQLQAVFQRDGYVALYRHVFQLNHAMGEGEAPPQGTIPQMEFAASVISANMEIDTLKCLIVNAREEEHMQVFHVLSSSLNRRLIKPILEKAW